MEIVKNVVPFLIMLHPEQVIIGFIAVPSSLTDTIVVVRTCLPRQAPSADCLCFGSLRNYITCVRSQIKPCLGLSRFLPHFTVPFSVT